MSDTSNEEIINPMQLHDIFMEDDDAASSYFYEENFTKKSTQHALPQVNDDKSYNAVTFMARSEFIEKVSSKKSEISSEIETEDLLPKAGIFFHILGRQGDTI